MCRYDPERIAVQEKDRLKKEMALKIKETNLSLMKLTDNQLEITTKRTIMENEQMSSDLATVSRSTEKLINKNEVGLLPGLFNVLFGVHTRAKDLRVKFTSAYSKEYVKQTRHCTS